MESNLIAQGVFGFLVAYYFITLLQWYSYSLYRVVSKHHKVRWHFFYFVIPLGVHFALYGYNIWLYASFIGVYFVSLCLWVRGLDKPLKFTPRVFRFFIIYALFFGLCMFLSFHYGVLQKHSILIGLAFGYVFSSVFEFILLRMYKKMAKQKIESRLKIVLITASFGKTSIKNFLFEILSKKFEVLATPRSVNTLKGIISDINQNLKYNTDIYIVEAGARNKGDIRDISLFLQNQYCIIGQIGAQHMEYFKTLDNVVKTKFEALSSPRLRKAFVYKDNPTPKILLKPSLVELFPHEIKNIHSDLEGTSFELFINGDWHCFHTKVLGKFNAYNISLAIAMAKELGVGIETIKSAVANLSQIEHRLSKIQLEDRLILDDSFNGNLDGMKEAIRLSSTYVGRRIIVTPGIVESTKEANEELAKLIDEVFDIAIITGELNSETLMNNMSRPQKVVIKDKHLLEDALKACVRRNDLILFANDAPSYI